MEKTLSSFIETVFDPMCYLSWQGDFSLVQQSGVLPFDPTGFKLIPQEGRLVDKGENNLTGRLMDWTFFQIIEDDLVNRYEEVCEGHSDIS